MSGGLKKSLLALSVSSVFMAPTAVFATNGMSLEGYGPIATGMGGASMAYENGSAAMMNNPATLGLMEDGQNRLEIAAGILAPKVTASATGAPDAESSGGPYMMPAVGWTKKDGQITYGFGLFAQGGMGTEYAGDSFLAAGTGQTVRSEVGVGRMMLPFAYEVNDKLSVGATVDLVWAGMDLKMAMLGDSTGFGDFLKSDVSGGAFNGANNAGVASGTLVDGLLSNVGTMLNDGTGTGDGLGTGPINNVRFDFSNSSDYTGEAKSTGFGAKLGFVYKLNSKLTLGGTYQLKTRLGDMTTNNATVSMNANADQGYFAATPAPTGTYTATDIPITGKLTIVDFQWPAAIGFGGAFQMSDKLMLVGDIKQIRWADVMDSFRMTFTADTSAANGAFGGASMNVEMYQNWENQTVIQLGGAYKLDSALTLRAGLNLSSNPVPDQYLNPLFPATTENHVTGGLGYKIDASQSLDVSLAYVPEVSATAGNGVTMAHSQLNWQFMYTNNF